MIQVYPDPESLSRAAAEMFAQKAAQAMQAQGRFSVGLSGGHTPKRAYEMLAQPPLRDQTPWAQTHIFWGDERCVPADDPRSNERMARLALLDHVPVPLAQIHPMRCTQAPGIAARQYEALLRSYFSSQPPRFDLILLGLGENGHTASLFPDTPALDEQKRWVADVYVAEQELDRITLTASLINQAATVAFLVTGAAKAEVLRQVLKGPWNPHHLPAQLIRPAKGELRWLVDEAASQKLSSL
jgi:6-phosphogluconolactonase